MMSGSSVRLWGGFPGGPCLGYTGYTWLSLKAFWVYTASDVDRCCCLKETSTSMAITPASSAICCHPFLSRNAKVHLSSVRRLPANRSKECRPLKTSCFPKVVAMDGEQPVGYLTNSTNFPGPARPHILTLQPLASGCSHHG